MSLEKDNSKTARDIIFVRHIRGPRIPPFGSMLLADSLLKSGFSVRIYDGKPSEKI